jgi:hypothetical protein
VFEFVETLCGFFEPGLCQEACLVQSLFCGGGPHYDPQVFEGVDLFDWMRGCHGTRFVDDFGVVPVGGEYLGFGNIEGLLCEFLPFTEDGELFS